VTPLVIKLCPPLTRMNVGVETAVLVLAHTPRTEPRRAIAEVLTAAPAGSTGRTDPAAPSSALSGPSCEQKAIDAPRRYVAVHGRLPRPQRFEAQVWATKQRLDGVRGLIAVHSERLACK